VVVVVAAAAAVVVVVVYIFLCRSLYPLLQKQKQNPNLQRIFEFLNFRFQTFKPLLLFFGVCGCGFMCVDFVWLFLLGYAF
jgi:hypothetical protein